MKTQKIKGLKEEFDSEVLRVYDDKLKGNYFIHQHMPNLDGKGIDYDSGGKELALKGGRIILQGSKLYENDFKELFEETEIEHNKIRFDYDKMELKYLLEDKKYELEYFQNSLKRLTEEEEFSYRFKDYSIIYSAICNSPKITPKEYRQELGEMIFHQRRLDNMCALGMDDGSLFSYLNNLLKLIPDENFLDKERLKQFGEGLVREVLRNKSDCLNLDTAKEAVKKYNLDDRKLIQAIEEMGRLEMDNKKQRESLQNKLKEQYRNHMDSRQSILANIDKKMFA